LAGEWDNTTGQAYAFIDGVPVQLFLPSPYVINTDPWRTSTSAFCVGGVTTDNQPFNGRMDEARVSNNLVFGAGLPTIAGNPPTTPPANLSYSVNPAVYKANAAITNNVPTVSGTVTHYSVTPPLARRAQAGFDYRHYFGDGHHAFLCDQLYDTASNSLGSTTAVLNITVLAPSPPSNLSYSRNPAIYGVAWPSPPTIQP